MVFGLLGTQILTAPLDPALFESMIFWSFCQTGRAGRLGPWVLGNGSDSKWEGWTISKNLSLVSIVGQECSSFTLIHQDAFLKRFCLLPSFCNFFCPII